MSSSIDDRNEGLSGGVERRRSNISSVKIRKGRMHVRFEWLRGKGRCDINPTPEDCLCSMSCEAGQETHRKLRTKRRSESTAPFPSHQDGRVVTMVTSGNCSGKEATAQLIRNYQQCVLPSFATLEATFKAILCLNYNFERLLTTAAKRNRAFHSQHLSN